MIRSKVVAVWKEIREKCPVNPILRKEQTEMSSDNQELPPPPRVGLFNVC